MSSKQQTVEQDCRDILERMEIPDDVQSYSASRLTEMANIIAECYVLRKEVLELRASIKNSKVDGDV